MKKKYLFLTTILIAVCATAVYAETITLSTYYPAPFGAYDRLKLVPRDPAGMICNANALGMLWVDRNTNMLQFCGDAAAGGFATIGVWAQKNNDPNPAEVYLFDQTRDINVGIGTTTPALGSMLHVAGPIFTHGVLRVTGSDPLIMQFIEVGGIAEHKNAEFIQETGILRGRFLNDVYTTADTWLEVKRNAGTYTTKDVSFPSGNVGIGTPNPVVKLQVEGPTTAYNLDAGLIMAQINGTSKRVNIGYDTNINAGYIQSVESGDWNKPLLLNANGGNVGIGTITPNAKLEINGGMRLNTAAAKPACDAANGPNIRGTQWITQGGAGVADALEFCLKKADNTYAWSSGGAGGGGGVIGGCALKHTSNMGSPNAANEWNCGNDSWGDGECYFVNAWHERCRCNTATSLLLSVGTPPPPGNFSNYYSLCIDKN